MSGALWRMRFGRWRWDSRLWTWTEIFFMRRNVPGTVMIQNIKWSCGGFRMHNAWYDWNSVAWLVRWRQCVVRTTGLLNWLNLSSTMIIWYQLLASQARLLPKTHLVGRRSRETILPIAKLYPDSHWILRLLRDIWLVEILWFICFLMKIRHRSDNPWWDVFYVNCAVSYLFLKFFIPTAEYKEYGKERLSREFLERIWDAEHVGQVCD